jgi:hypothetical protein
MKKTCLLLLLSLAFLLNAKAQVINNLVVFTNDGERFTLILNGETQNLEPAVRVTSIGLTLEVYKVTLLFENKKLKTHNTTLTFFDTNTECLFVLNKHGRKHTMDYVTSTPINQEPPKTKQNSTTPSDGTITTPSTSSTPTNTTTTPPTNTTTIPSNSNTPINNDNSGDITIGDKNGSLDVGTNGVKINTHGVNMNVDEKNKNVNTSVHVLGKDISLNKSIKTGCKSPMSGLDFDESKKGVLSQKSDSTMMIAALKITNANCMLTSQLSEIMVLFKTDLTRLHFAKEAYSHTSDLHNFNKLEETFTSEQGKKDLRHFIKNPE